MTLLSQLKRARDWLCNLGQDVSSIDDALSYRSTNSGYQNIGVFDDGSSYSGEFNGQLEQERTAASTQRFEGPLRLARGSAADLETMTRDSRSLASSTFPQLNAIHGGPSNFRSFNMPHAEASEQPSGTKRKRTETATDVSNGQRMTSRDAMPPPQLPPRRLSQYEPEFGIFHMSVSPPHFRPPPILSRGDTLAPGPSRNASESPATATGHASPLDSLHRNDGELDTMRFHQPTPQRPVYRPSSLSPARQRLTLTPRSSAPGRLIGPGLLSHARSSSAAGILTPRGGSSSSTTTASHRQQLGQSPYFTPRELPATPRFRGSEVGSETDASIVNRLSFREDPVAGSTGGRRRARR